MLKARPSQKKTPSVRESMRNYFVLQYSMANRHLSEFGVNPFLGAGLLVFGFVGLSIVLFTKTEFAAYIYPLIALAIISKLSETGRNDFLKTIFNELGYYRIRIIENCLVALPFIIFLTVKSSSIPILILLLSAFALVFVNFKNQFNFTIPTPFQKHPFEFIVGFRSNLVLIISTWFFTVMSIIFGNFNLGIFSLLLAFLIFLSFYGNPENGFYVWVFSLAPHKFLLRKINTAIFCSTLLCLPITLALSVSFYSNVFIIIGLQALCCLYLATIILAKYSVFPNQMNLPQLILLALSVGFPPLLLVVIPFFYTKSINRLNALLQ